MPDEDYDAKLKELESSYKNLSTEQFAEKAVQIAVRQLAASTEFKKPRLAKLSKYWELYDGKVSKKLRQLFNIPIPIYAGLIDTLNAQYDTPIELRFTEADPSDYFKAEKINAAWKMEMGSTAQNTMWDSKLRLARAHAIMNGRTILEYSAESDPEYKSILDVVNLKDFHFQPKGGLWLENHLFAGREGIEKTSFDLIAGAKAGIYNKKQVLLLIDRSGNKDYLPASDQQEKLSRFKPLGLDAENNSYVGQAVYRLAHFILELDGKRWYLCFEPWTNTWIRFEKWSEIDSSDLYPWHTYATHEDDENFLSKSYGDDLYPVADATITLFNQEATNREKRNNASRGYDKDMIMDVRKFDEASYRPDGIFAVDTKGGTRRISEAVYEFKYGELGGTINLLDWMKQNAGTDVGVTEVSQGQAQEVSKKASVTFAEQKSVSKRLSWGAQPYQQMLGGLGKAYIYGLRDHMPAKMAIQLIGDKGQDWDEITRLDLNTTKDINIKIVSTDKEVQDSEMKKASRKEGLMAIGADPILAQTVNPKWRAEEMLRSVAGYDDVEVAEALDTSTFGSKKALAHAAVAIELIDQGKKPDMYYGADTAFMQKIIDVARDKQGKNPKLAMKLTDYAMAHQGIVQQNMQQKAMMLAQASAQSTVAAPTEQPAGGSAPTPSAGGTGIPSGVQHAMNMAGV